ncbi:PAT complex subunit CCDC47 [Neocloeon triangulifer]|uniref:PAT complex subunit CCDC47 n=1 Tax=Neocloeon triangulifer TaxID=2078957 RepID=UPI00286F7E41|nr:PAT complex subunit CCDC47 [Neocloeon triangulifer]XP_059475811.1 PAT complex subunit CCDC47 [Neocloeon triangulifer]
MRLPWVLLTCLLVSVPFLAAEKDEFAEFEDFEEEFENVASSPDAADSIEDAEVEVEDEEEPVLEDLEMEHLADEEEFEGWDAKEPVGGNKEVPRLTITKVPMHLRTNWDSYYLEMLMLAGLAVYFLNFMVGRSKNQRLANAWFSAHKSLLEENFSLVGDDGSKDIDTNTGLIKESENVFTLWCSGRTCCEGMLVELKLLKRQDLVAVISQMLRPVADQVQVRVNLTEVDSFVMCIASKKTALRLVKDMADINVFCPERKSLEKMGVSPSFNLMNEIGEVSASLIDRRMVDALNKYSDLIDCIHVSDQYTGPKLPQDESSAASKLPEASKVLICTFNLPTKQKTPQEAAEAARPLMQLVFYLLERVKRLKLGKEAKIKAINNRQKAQEAFLKTTHAARAEAAAARREDKRRQEKERILAEDDPEKQRRWEEKENKRQMKKKAPKMKQLKVKAI